MASLLTSRIFLLMLMGLAGCSSAPLRPDHNAVRSLVAPHLSAAELPATWPSDGLAQSSSPTPALTPPVQREQAVALALRHNRQLRAALAELGVAQAEFAQALSWPAPRISLGISGHGSEVEFELGVHTALTQLLARPWLEQVHSARLDQARLKVAQQVMDVALQTRQAWVQAVAAEELLRYAVQVNEAAAASAELARRMAAVGNFSALQQMREQVFYAEAAAQLASAQHHRVAQREHLARLMGLWGDQLAFELPTRLPDLPSSPLPAANLESVAIAQRLDVRLARSQVLQRQQAWQWQQSATGAQVIDAGAHVSRNNDGSRGSGIELGWQWPWGQSRRATQAQAQAAYQQSQALAEHTAIVARSQVRQAYDAYRTSWDLARHHRDEIVPLKKRISEENLLRYNAMLIGVFELLADARAQIMSVQAAIGAARDFWLADIDLQRALLGPAQLTLAMPVAPAAASMGSDAH